MKKMEIKKCGREWYVIVKDENGKNFTMASFSTKKKAMEVRKNWIESKRFDEAEAI